MTVPEIQTGALLEVLIRLGNSKNDARLDDPGQPTQFQSDPLRHRSPSPETWAPRPMGQVLRFFKVKHIISTRSVTLFISRARRAVKNPRLIWPFLQGRLRTAALKRSASNRRVLQRVHAAKSWMTNRRSHLLILDRRDFSRQITAKEEQTPSGDQSCGLTFRLSPADLRVLAAEVRADRFLIALIWFDLAGESRALEVVPVAKRQFSQSFLDTEAATLQIDQLVWHFRSWRKMSPAFDGPDQHSAKYMAVVSGDNIARIVSEVEGIECQTRPIFGREHGNLASNGQVMLESGAGSVSSKRRISDFTGLFIDGALRGLPCNPSGYRDGDNFLTELVSSHAQLTACQLVTGGGGGRVEDVGLGVLRANSISERGIGPVVRDDLGGVEDDVTILIPTWSNLDGLRVAEELFLDLVRAGTTLVVGRDGNEAVRPEDVFPAGSPLEKSLEVRTGSTRVGFSENVNQLVRGSRSQYVVILNSDAVIDRMSMIELVRVLKRHAEVKMVSPLSNSSGTNSLRSVGQVLVDPLDPEIHLYLNQALRDGLTEDAFIAPVVSSGFCMCVERDWFLGIGGLDHQIFASGYGAENELACRALVRGEYGAISLRSFSGHVGNPTVRGLHSQAKERAATAIESLGYGPLNRWLLKNSSASGAVRSLDVALAQLVSVVKQTDHALE